MAQVSARRGSTVLRDRAAVWKGGLAGLVMLIGAVVTLEAAAQPRGAPPRPSPPASTPPTGHQNEAIDLNEGRSPAELFKSGCAVCHQSAAGLAKGRGERELTGFLRQHYSSSVQHAAMLAGYVASIGRAAPPAPAARQAPVERPPASVGRRPAEEEQRRPQEAARPAEREPAAKRKPPAAPAGRATPTPATPPTAAAAAAAVAAPEPAPEPEAEAKPADEAPAPVETKPPPPEIPL